MPPAASPPRPRLPKRVSEAARERETFKYEPTIYDDFRFNDTGVAFPSSAIASSSDSILTGLCQLGAYQTHTEKAFVSVFDATHQYIVAEACPGMSLSPDLPSHESPLPLALRGIAIPRSQGTCEHVLYLASGNLDSQQRLPSSVVPNLIKDDRFNKRPYCQFGEPGQFYAAVPIRTRNGINIGSYCVMSERQPEKWSENSVQHLRDISQSIMDHLERKRTATSLRQMERLKRGLTSFVEGKATIARLSGTDNDPFLGKGGINGSVDATQTHLDRLHLENQEQDEADIPVQADPALLGRSHTTICNDYGTSNTYSTEEFDSFGANFDKNRATNLTASSRGGTGPSKAIELVNNDTAHVFARASNILREAFEVDGCLFLNAPLDLNPSTTYKAGDSPGSPHSVTSAGYHSPTGSSSSSSDDSSEMHSSTGDSEAASEVLSFSTANTSSFYGASCIDGVDGIVPKRLLARLLRRYPQGTILNFDADGELQSTDCSDNDSSDEATAATKAKAVAADKASPSTSPSTSPRPRVGRGSGRLKDGARIHQAFPSARSVAFVPVWDSKRERWLSGGFIWTHTPARFFSADAELSLFNVFSKVIAADALNLKMMRASKAKSDALGSISHELRSPLHGVILGTELLSNTDLTVFQQNATHTIETCSRTLLDTIEHLLDFSKVNDVAVKRKHEANGPVPGLRRRSTLKQLSEKNLYSHVRLDALVEEVVESMFAGFRFQHMSIRQSSKQSSLPLADLEAQTRLDSARAMEQLAPGSTTQGEYDYSQVNMLLSIDPECDWLFLAQPGAFRRVIMNLCGNALKYTSKGTVRISLTQEDSKRSRKQRVVKFVVQDTGKGMSEDFCRHGLFRPFSQEDELAPGTGLGLSIVKSIVSQLRGQISVESHVGHGTKFTVRIPLEQSSAMTPTETSPQSMETEDDLAKHIRGLKGLRVRLAGFDSSPEDQLHCASLEGMCRRWLEMDVITGDESNADIILWSEKALPDQDAHAELLRKAPMVVVCQDTLAAYRRHALFDTLGNDGVLNFISQPIGPRKLARSLLHSYEKWSEFPKHQLSRRPVGPIRSQSSYDGQLPTQNAYLKSPELVQTLEPQIWQPIIPPPTPSDTTTPVSDLSSPIQAPYEPAVIVQPTPEKILIVDDNAVNLKVLAAYMRKLSRPYEAATNGQEAVEAFTRAPHQFLAIMMDISMPVMDGLEATRRIRAVERNIMKSPVAIMALTGLASDSVRREALESGVDVFLSKPVKLQTLNEVLESMNIWPSSPDTESS